MQIEQFYTLVGGDYQKMVSMLGNADNVVKYAKMFMGDDTFEKLVAAMEEERWADAFRFAHTMKGVTSSIGLNDLYNASYALTEDLRPDDAGNPSNLESAKEKLQDVVDTYNTVVEASSLLD